MNESFWCAIGDPNAGNGDCKINSNLARSLPFLGKDDHKQIQI